MRGREKPHMHKDKEIVNDGCMMLAVHLYHLQFWSNKILMLDFCWIVKIS
jgi:hypothetical protein